MWYVINRLQKDPGGKVTHTIQQVINGEVQESTNQEDTEDFILEETEMRFVLAGDAPISKTQLIKHRGYLVDTEVAPQIIEGSYEILEAMDDATALLLTEIRNLLFV